MYNKKEKRKHCVSFGDFLREEVKDKSPKITYKIFKMIRHVWLILVFISVVLTGVRCLKNVSLQLIPEVVERGREVVLRCDYDLEDAPLYSLKWYRGFYEFYRYSPSENPSTKIFNFSWINVDANNSNERQVVIQNVEFQLSGNFSCEVTTDAPTFSTESSYKTLTVVSLPKGKPVIKSERGRYESGEILKANCTTPYSKPATQLSFTLNNMPVESYSKDYNQKHENINNNNNNIGDQQQHPQWTHLNLTLHPYHYHNGQLSLRCIAKITGIYEQSSEIQLGSQLREPIHQRVRSDNISIHYNHRIADLTIAVLIVILFHLR